MALLRMEKPSDKIDWDAPDALQRLAADCHIRLDDEFHTPPLGLIYNELMRLNADLEIAELRLKYYEGGDVMGPYELLLGPEAPNHRFNNEGICIRCGEDAEEWEAGCVEELAATLDSTVRAQADTEATLKAVHAWSKAWKETARRQKIDLRKLHEYNGGLAMESFERGEANRRLAEYARAQGLALAQVAEERRDGLALLEGYINALPKELYDRLMVTMLIDPRLPTPVDVAWAKAQIEKMEKPDVT